MPGTASLLGEGEGEFEAFTAPAVELIATFDEHRCTSGRDVDSGGPRERLLVGMVADRAFEIVTIGP